MSAEELAQQILAMINHFNEQVQVPGGSVKSETEAVDLVFALVDDIEELCRKQLPEENNTSTA